jgi:hypothetical protein
MLAADRQCPVFLRNFSKWGPGTEGTRAERPDNKRIPEQSAVSVTGDGESRFLFFIHPGELT